MSKFNEKTATTTQTVNRAGGEAHAETPKLELVSLLLTSFVQDQFYRSENEGVEQVKSLINTIADKRFVAKAAVYARNEFGMRSISHLVAGELAGSVKGVEWSKNFFDKVIRRPDDMTEILAYYYANYGKTEPNALKKGFAQAFQRFDEYQLGKYRKAGESVSLVDVVNLVHPKPTEAIGKLVRDELRNTNTFESKLSAAGEAGDAEAVDVAKAEAWKQLVAERRIGYFALLRNLRNIIEQAQDVLPQALELLVDEKLIRNSLVLPFRFVTAIEEISKLNGPGVQRVLMALNKAVDISLANVPKFDGETLVVLDISGSMRGKPSEIGSLFAAVLAKANLADLITFGSVACYQTINPADSTLTIAKGLRFDGGGTNFPSIFETANRAYDNVVILSDMQGWQGGPFDYGYGGSPKQAFAAYRRRTGADPKVFSFDLQGYGTLMFPERNVFAIAGFSDKVFELMKLLSQDRNALVKKIEGVEL